MTFKEFKESKQFGKFSTIFATPEAKQIFDILSKPINILRMIFANSIDRPALEGCVKEIENTFPASFFTDYAKQYIGTCVRVILHDFYLDPCKVRNIKSKYFGTAAMYSTDRDLDSLFDIKVIESKKRKETL